MLLIFYGTYVLSRMLINNLYTQSVFCISLFFFDFLKQAGKCDFNNAPQYTSPHNLCYSSYLLTFA